MTNGKAAYPYGIERRDFHPPRQTGRKVLLALLLGAPLGLAVAGLLGGGAPKRLEARTEAVTLSVELQPIVRSGNWFETQVVATPRRAVADLVVAIDEDLWRRMSIDTLAPDAEEAAFKDGAFRYSFGPVEAGERFLLKLDGQFQAWGARRLQGNVRLYDGERPLARVPLTITVLP